MKRMKYRILLAAVIVSVILTGLAVFYVNEVQEQLWEQSVSSIMEGTQQGSNTLRVQLEDEYESMDVITEYLNTLTVDQTDKLEETVGGYEQVNSGIRLFFTDGSLYPLGASIDEEAVKALSDETLIRGIIDPHISSVTGANVFDLYTKVLLQDGTSGYLLKEFEVDQIVDSFSLSFYNNEGFSYVMDEHGNILIRPPHPGSNKTVRNLFDMLPEEENAQDSLRQFEESLQAGKTGWATFYYMGEDTVFCYIPLGLGSDWYLISIIPKAVVSAQTNDILIRTMILIAAILLGIALLVVLYFRHISRTNRRLRSQADYIGHLYNAVPEGIALLTLEEPYRFLQLNQEGLRLLGYPQKAAGGRPEEEKLQNVVHPEDYEGLTDILYITAVSGQKNHFENRLVKANGSYFWAAGLVEKTRDESGEPILIATFHDITADKMAEEEEEREKQQERIMLVSAISSAYPVIISLNLTKDHLKFIYAQDGLMVNMGHQKTYSELYREFSKTLHPDHVEEFRRRFAPENVLNKLGAEGTEVFMEARHMLADGQYHWIFVQIISVENPYSDDRLAILISRRIDEQRHEEEQQRQALQSALENAKAASVAKSQFLSNMSHDIRTPMNAIVGMTAIAATHLEERDRVAECLKKISFSSQHLLSLINDILDMSKIESGKLSLREEPFNLAELVSDVTELVRVQAEAGGLKLRVRLPVMKDEKVIGDPLRIRQVYLNILSNAVKYTPKGGRVTIEVRQEPSRQRGYQNYVFRCSDTGIGMSQEFLQRIYQPFERAQNDMTGKVAGTGLGLAITKNIIDLMGGDIHVESEEKKGSVFTVTLPIRQQDVQQEVIPPRWVGVRCMIVDDDRQTCENAAELLDSIGLRAEFVTEGAAAVRRVIELKDTKDPFELVIIDWKMPVMDGIETTRQIRKAVGREIPVIILTAYDWAEIENEARQAGVTAFLAKPFYRSKICYMLNELGNEQKPPAEVEASSVDCIGRRVLLVEDNAMNREIARELIQETGAAVEEAYNGAEAVRMMNDVPEGYYDLVFMDIQMPVMDGYEAAKAIRKLERRDVQTVPIIAMTADAFEEDIRKALRAGMNAHFPKPINVKELKKLLGRYLGKASE